MIKVTWECEKCRKKKETNTSLEDGWHIDVAPPKGWGAVIEIDVLLCPQCKNERMTKWREENPHAVLMA